MKKWVIGLGILVLLAAIAVAIGYRIVFGSNTNAYDGERSVLVPRGASFVQVTDSLVARGILDSRGSFELVGKLTGWADQVKAGHYAFESGASNYDLLERIRKGLQSPVQVTIPPGTRPAVIAAVAGRDMEFGADAFRETLADTALAQELGTDVRHLFGYMLPETYFFYWLEQPQTVVRRVKEQFDQYYDKDLREGAEAQGLSKDDVLTLASIVEWETALESEKPRVAGVYLNRIQRGWPLQADPTVQFAVMEHEGQKRRLLNADYAIDHPYNTYSFRGLPPGPVTNPSPSSLHAVAFPEKHDFMYFVAKGDGSHTFSRTLQEHNRAAAEYHRMMIDRRRAQAADTTQ